MISGTLIKFLVGFSLILLAEQNRIQPNSLDAEQKYNYFDDYLSSLDEEQQAIITGELRPSEGSGDELTQETQEAKFSLPLRAGLTGSKDVTCCFLGQLAGDKGYHCYSRFYAARILLRNENRAHNRKMGFHGHDSVPNYGTKLMRTFEQCVASRRMVFNKCCHFAAVERKSRPHFDSVQRKRYELKMQKIRMPKPNQANGNKKIQMPKPNQVDGNLADNWECGLRNENVSSYIIPKILGGKKVDAEWPWMAALYFIPYNTTDQDNAKIQCAGTVIHRSFILTAAHCLFVIRRTISLKRNPGEITVKLGLTKLTDKKNMQEFEVSEFFIHINYSHGNNNFDYDIALLKLKQPIEYNDFIRPICLPPLELPENNTFYEEKHLGLVPGWGHEEILLPFAVRNVKFTDHLKELVIRIQSPSTCNRSLLNRKEWIFTDRMFCAGNGLGGNDPCAGDSGGPFMQWQKHSEGYYYFTQVGIVSWGVGCGFPGTYGFYTHVQNLRGWIDETIENAVKEIV